MNDLTISLLVFVVIFAGALIGMVVRPFLSEHHQTADSREVVKMTTGLIGTLTALVLGLLIASAKNSFDQKTNQVRQLTATIILLDDLLMRYGPEATHLRNLLRQSIQPLANRIWHEEEMTSGRPVRFEASVESSAFEIELGRLSPNNDLQRSLQSRATQAFTEAAQIRLQLFAQTSGSIPTPFLVILVFWLGTIFVSLHLVCTSQSDRDDFPVRMRAIVRLRDFSGLGAGQSLQRADGHFERDAAKRVAAAKSLKRVSASQAAALVPGLFVLGQA